MDGYEGVGTGAYGANVGGLADTSGVLEVDESGKRKINYEGTALSALKVGAAAANGAATFSAAAGPGGGVAAAVFGVVGDALTGGFQAYNAQKCHAALEKAYREAKTLPDGPDKDALCQCLEGCLAKSAIKFRKGVGKASIAGQPGVALYRAGKAIYKFSRGTKGKGRQNRAETLIRLAKERTHAGLLARFAVTAIVGMQFEKIMTSAVADAMKSG